jgi:hypothetical protein
MNRKNSAKNEGARTSCAAVAESFLEEKLAWEHVNVKEQRCHHWQQQTRTAMVFMTVLLHAL